jgi:hypothetical protein
MAFELVLKDEELVTASTGVDGPKGGAAKGVSRVFFSNLPEDYKVFLLYYRAGMGDRDLEDKLEDLGKNAGKNLLVNLGSAKDPSYNLIVSRFEIKKFPVIIMTAVPDLASPGDEDLTTYAKLDSEQLLSSPEKTVECAEKLFNLFIQGKVAEAISKAKWTQRAELAGAVGHVLLNALKAVGGFIASRDLSVSVLEGKFEIKRSGG